MEKNTLNRLKIELESFKGLVIANLVGAALTLAFTMAFGVEKVIPFITGGPLTPGQIPYVMLIVSGFVVAISWIAGSADLMGEHDEITKDFDEILKEGGDDEAITSIIVRSLAFYRENQDKINQLKWGGRITGTFMLVSGIPQLIDFITGSYPFGGLLALAQGFAVVASMGVGIAAWYVPVIIKRFTEMWDERLSLADDVNEKLRKILEDSE